MITQNNFKWEKTLVHICAITIEKRKILTSVKLNDSRFKHLQEDGERKELNIY